MGGQKKGTVRVSPEKAAVAEGEEGKRGREKRERVPFRRCAHSLSHSHSHTHGHPSFFFFTLHSFLYLHLFTPLPPPLLPPSFHSLPFLSFPFLFVLLCSFTTFLLFTTSLLLPHSSSSISTLSPLILFFCIQTSRTTLFILFAFVFPTLTASKAYPFFFLLSALLSALPALPPPPTAAQQTSCPFPKVCCHT